MARLDDRRFVELVRDLRARLGARVPGWSDRPDSDPGVTLLQLMTFLGEALLERGARIPERGLARLARVLEGLHALCDPDTPALVWVNGEPWRPVARLAEAGPDEAVYALDAERGTLQFGDGVHGRIPPPGASIRVRYRHGAGSAGALETWLATAWPPGAATLEIATRPEGALRFTLTRPACERGGRPRRVRYAEGRLLAARDLQDEQEYHRAKHRRHNRVLHGHGIVRGLEVSVEALPGQPPRIRVAPGVALTPEGEEVVVAEPVTCEPPGEATGWYLTLAFAERDAEPAPLAGEGGEPVGATRVEEGYRLAFQPAPGPGVVPLARLVRDQGEWRVDGVRS